jgi:arsenical resistance protein ArsH
MRPSTYYDRVAHIMEKLVRFTLRTCGTADHLTDCYPERKGQAAKAAEAQS